jgi:hypothetical protein
MKIRTGKKRPIPHQQGIRGEEEKDKKSGKRKKKK